VVRALQGFDLLSPGALAENLVEIQGHGLFGDEAFDFVLQVLGQYSHEGLGGETVLGALLVITLRHILEQIVSGKVNIVDDFAQIFVEVGVGQILEVVQSVLGNVALPLEFTFALFTDGSEVAVFVHPLDESLGHLEVLSGRRHLSSGERKVLLLLFADSVDGVFALFPEVTGEADKVEVLLNVVHDFGLEESLCGVIHDFVAELGLGDVLAELLDAGALGSGTVLVDDLIALSLGGGAVGEGFGQLLDHFEFAPEEGVLGGVDGVLVHAEEVHVDSGNGLDEAFVGGGELELAEKARADAAGGGAAETDLAVDDNGGVDVGAEESVADGVKVLLQGSGRVAHRDPVVGESGECLLDLLDDVVEGLDGLDLDLLLGLGDLDDLDFALAGLDAAFEDLLELDFVILHGFAGDVSELGVLSNLVGGSGADGVAVDIDDGLLSHVDPHNFAVLGVLVADSLVDGIDEALSGGLTAAVDLVARHSAEVGCALDDSVLELLDLFEVVGHGGGLPDLGVILLVSHLYSSFLAILPNTKKALCWSQS
jgi:hypothetical protein